MKPTILPEDIISDPKEDEGGILLAGIKTGTRWTPQRRAELDGLAEKLASLNYQKFTGNKILFGLSGVGDSILYRVPIGKNGHLKPYRGQLVRLVCVRSVKSLGFNSEIMVGPYVPPSLKGF